MQTKSRDLNWQLAGVCSVPESPIARSENFGSDIVYFIR